MLWKAWNTPTLPYCCWNCCFCYCIVLGSLMHTHNTILLLKLLLLLLLYSCEKLVAQPQYHTVAETPDAAAIVLLWEAWCTSTLPYCCFKFVLFLFFSQSHHEQRIQFVMSEKVPWQPMLHALHCCTAMRGKINVNHSFQNLLHCINELLMVLELECSTSVQVTQDDTCNNILVNVILC